MKRYLNLIGLVCCTFFGVATVVLLFRWSEDIIHQRNPFIRRYVNGCVKMHQKDLGYNSYYFAGFSDKDIFLGNTTSPLKVTSVDSSLADQTSFKMVLDDYTLPFASPVLRVQPPHLYFIDGSVPVLFKGDLVSGRLYKKWEGTVRFSHPQLIDSITLGCRIISQDTKESELARLDFGAMPELRVFDSLLQRQADGIFDSEGSLQYSKSLNKIVYTYRYRNEFFVAGPGFGLEYRGTTIDTISRAKLKVTRIDSRGEIKLSQAPNIVNRLSAIDNNLLFVASSVVGQYEDLGMWRQCTIIDVYDVERRSYVASFYVYHIGNQKARAIAVDRGRFYALIGNFIVYYRLDHLITQHYRNRKN